MPTQYQPILDKNYFLRSYSGLEIIEISLINMKASVQIIVYHPKSLSSRAWACLYYRQ